ncbi:MAG: hypothetical protein QM500_12155 [Methylococcales bacterium]
MSFTKTYWVNDGEYQSDYKRLSDKLVPALGRADNAYGELLRSLSIIYNDRFDNKLRSGFWTECRYLIDSFKFYKPFCTNPDAVFSTLRNIENITVHGRKPVEDVFNPEDVDTNWDEVSGCYIKVPLWSLKDDENIENALSAIIKYLLVIEKQEPSGLT